MSQDLATTGGTEVASVGSEHLDDFVTFVVGGQLFGIPVLWVQDILTPDNIAPVPLAPPEVRGNINLRGRIVTVIDVRVRLGLETLDAVDAANEAANEADGETDSEKTPVTTKARKEMGVTVENKNDLYTLLVDDIGDVISVEKDRFDGNVSTLDPAWRDFSSGIYRLDDRLMVVFDVERLLEIELKKKVEQKTA